MSGFETVRVAAVQATPVILEAEATIDKAVDLVAEAADRGAALVVFPECFVSVYRVGRGRRRRPPGPRAVTSCGSGCGRRASTSADRWSIA